MRLTRMMVETPLDCAPLFTVWPLALRPSIRPVRSSEVLAPSTLVVGLLVAPKFTSEVAWGPEGYLADKGLIPLPEKERKEVAKAARALTPMAKP